MGEIRASATGVVVAALKILGLLTALATVRSGLQLVSVRLGGWGPSADIGGYVFWNGLYVIASGAVALGLLLRTRKVADWVLGHEGESVLELGAARTLVPVGLAIAGAVVALRALPHVVSNAAELVWWLGAERRKLSEVHLESSWPDYLFWAVSLVAGLLVARRAWDAVLLATDSSEDDGAAS